MGVFGREDAGKRVGCDGGGTRDRSGAEEEFASAHLGVLIVTGEGKPQQGRSTARRRRVCAATGTSQLPGRTRSEYSSGFSYLSSFRSAGTVTRCGYRFYGPYLLS